MAQAKIIIGAKKGLRQVMQRVDMVAKSDLPVILHGETGTGKEVVALAIHERSDRRGKPFRRVNCGAISPALVDSELFGHERGAFSGATDRRKGWFEQADKGTLFLDEVAELTPSAQVRLLRVLQEGEMTRVGGEAPVRVDVRIVAATHRDLPEMIEKGIFREDLYYRLATFPIVIPPLRDRAEDFGPLVEHFAARAFKRFGLMPVAVTRDHVEVLRAYSWPGNIRELAAVIDRAVLLGDGETLEFAAALGPALPVERTAPIVRANPLAAGEVEPLDTVIKRHIEHALVICHGRIDGPFGAARRLELKPSTLRSKMRKLGIDSRRFR